LTGAARGALRVLAGTKKRRFFNRTKKLDWLGVWVLGLGWWVLGVWSTAWLALPPRTFGWEREPVSPWKKVFLLLFLQKKKTLTLLAFTFLIARKA
jgi:hypothetical protein